MKGLEAKYTAKHLAKMIKRNRSVEKKARRQSTTSCFDCAYPNYIVAQYVANENRKMSQEFRAFMIHNAFNKKRNFTTAEVEYLNLGENALASLASNQVDYSRYISRFKNQQKAIQIVKHQLLEKDQVPQFEEWLNGSGE
jgi:Fic family protein